MRNIVLFVSHRLRRCGVHEFGLEIADQLQDSKKYQFKYVECTSLVELAACIEENSPVAIVFNYHPTTMPWGAVAGLVCGDLPTVGIVHDVTSDMADNWERNLFSRLITHDPDLKTSNKMFFSAPRPLPKYRSAATPPDSGPVRLGSFGFAAPDKGFDKIVLAAQASFDACLIRLHIPGGDFGDVQGENARKLAAECRSLITKPGISLEVSHEFLSREELLDSLASNHINALFYDPDRGMGGISSASDLALAARRPLALRRGKMFRNFNSADPSIFIDNKTLPEILANGIVPLEPFLAAWTASALITAYEVVLDDAIGRQSSHALYRRNADLLDTFLASAKEAEAALQSRLVDLHGATVWLREQVDHKDQHITALTGHMEQYTREFHRANARARTAEDALHNRRLLGRTRLKLRHTRKRVPHFNTLLDDAARAYYARSIQTLWAAAPATMKRKIPEANIQQGFMLAAVESLLRSVGVGPILCVGSFEDTACLALQALRYDVDAIDPDLNYDLAGFKAAQPEKVGTYKVVFSTSVIEHVPDDEQFVRDLLEMTMPGGAVVLTCDFNDHWTPEQQKPSSNSRIYTIRDMDRLLAAMGTAELFDQPDWLSHQPDFSISEFGTTMHYGFAALAVRKLK